MHRRSLLHAALSYAAALSLGVVSLRSLATPNAGQVKHDGNTQRSFDALLGYDALSLSRLIEQKQITPQELLDIVLRRIDKANPLLNFMAYDAREQVSTRLADVPLDGVFLGVPFLIKDMVDVAGLPRTDGSRLLATAPVAPESVDYIAAIERAGLIPIGSTNAPEFASLSITANQLYGATRNPWNLHFSTFTSSGGTAAAVAAGVVPVAHGTDGAGSCRLPASAVGLLGMKPTRGIMYSGELDGTHDIAKTNQVISRTVRDSAAIFNVTEDRRDNALQDIPLVRRTMPSLRIGVMNIFSEATAARKPATGGDFASDLFEVSRALDPDVVSTLSDTVVHLEDEGHKVEVFEGGINQEEFSEAYLAFYAGKLGSLAAQLSGVPNANGRDLLTPWVATFMDFAEGIPKEQIQSAERYLSGLSDVIDRWFEKYDVVVSPVSPIVCPRLDEISPSDTFSLEQFHRMMHLLRFTGPINFGGHPAASIPVTKRSSSGIPVGAHFVARRGADRLLYDLAYVMEERVQWGDWWAPHSLMYATR